MSDESGFDNVSHGIEQSMQEPSPSITEEKQKLQNAWDYREIVRTKYGLPESSTRWAHPKDYIDRMESLLKEKGIQVRNKHEFQQFFKQNPDAPAFASPRSVHGETKVVVEELNDNDWYQLRARAGQLAHESVHALQAEKYPRMPDEEAEREAYYYQKLTPIQMAECTEDPTRIAYYLSVIEEDINNSVTKNEELKAK